MASYCIRTVEGMSAFSRRRSRVSAFEMIHTLRKDDRLFVFVSLFRIFGQHPDICRFCEVSLPIKKQAE